VSAARTRRRLMAHERYRRQAMLLGLRYQPMSHAHVRLLDRACADRSDRSYAWILRDVTPRRRTPP
jgi:hypothetical protein